MNLNWKIPEPKIVRRFREWFLGGPGWIILPEHVLQAKYRSWTVMGVMWIYGLAVKFFTVPGRMLIIVAAPIGGYTLMAMGTPIFVLAFVIFAVFILDFIGGWVFRPRVKIERFVPMRTRAGSPVKINYLLRNLRKFPLWNLTLDGNLPGKWFVGRKRAGVDCLEPKSEVRLETELKLIRRGKYPLLTPIADSSYPFGIFKWTCQNKFSQELLVYPQFEPLNFLELPTGQRYQRYGNSMVSKVGESMEFHGCREFRVGDDPRHIHWISTARTGELIVREFQEEYLTRIAVIVDTHVKTPSFFDQFLLRRPVRQEFESVLSLTAALADFLARGDFVIDIFAAGPKQVYHFQSGRSLGFLDQLLDILAGLNPNYDEPINQMSPGIMEEISGIGCALVLLLDWNKEREELIHKLRAHGVNVKIIIIGKKPDNAPDDAEVLSPEDIASGNVKTL